MPGRTRSLPYPPAHIVMDRYTAGEYSIVTLETKRACDRCGQALGAGETAIRSQFLPSGREVACASCALDTNVFELREALRNTAAAFAGRKELEKAIEARFAAIDARTRGANVECVPARDPKGRPRVRVLVHGLVISRVNVTGKAFWSELGFGHAFASPKREYAFDLPSGEEASLRSYDPTQPLVAYVYGLNARPADAITQSNDDRSLKECFARKFPPPLLWLQGVTEKTARDKHIPRAREIVERAGFDADACPVLCAKSMDRAALEALVGAMDEHFSGAEIAAVGAKKSRSK